MSNIPNRRKYTQEDILAEANMFLSGNTIKQVAVALKVPVSTVSWHLIYPLKEIDYATWMRVRVRLDKYAKDKSRVIPLPVHIKEDKPL